MSKKVLDIKQMQHLKELGVDTSKGSMYWHKITNTFTEKVENDWYLDIRESVDLPEITLISRKLETVPTFTLQDILDLLPICIIHEGENCELCIQRMYFKGGKIMHAVYYRLQYNVHWYVMQSYEELIDSAYEMLCWCIKNGYKQTEYEKSLLL